MATVQARVGAILRPLPLALVVTAIIGSGCKKDEETTTDPTLSISVETLDFGALPIGQEDTRKITLSNASEDVGVELLSVTLIEGLPQVFTVNTGNKEVVAGEDGVVNVTFSPISVEVFTGRVQIRTDFPGGEALFVELTGEGGASTDDVDGDGYSPADGDCDDENDQVNPGADELCDGLDNDCNGSTPGDEVDNDFDGVFVCADDCDDDDINVYPGAPEICDQKDSDCDGVENDNGDADNDGIAICDSPGDCDDDDDDVYPGNTETCDGLDNDCSGTIDDVDEDMDGHSPCAGAGDCDDNDPDAFPVVVANGGSAGGAGTEADPIDTIANAIGALDQVCRLILVQPGTYADVQVNWTASDGEVTIEGTGSDPGDVILQAATDARHFTLNGGDVTLDNLQLSGGNAPSDGGAIFVSTADLVLDDVVLDSNATSGGDGGGIALLSGDLTLEGDCVFANNTAQDDGGAIAAIGSTVTDVDGTVYEGNGASRGGALQIQGGTLLVSDARFEDNTAGEGGAISIDGAGDYTVQRSDIWSNSANSIGGGISLRSVDDADGQIRNNRIQDNIAGTAGGGIAATGDTVAIVVINNTLLLNAAGGAADQDGAAIHVDATDSSGMLIWSNLAVQSQGATGLHVGTGSGADLQYNTVFQTLSLVDFGGDAASADNTNDSDDPLLQSITNDGNPGNDDLTLQSASPAINNGVPGAPFQDPNGTRNDRGAYGGPQAP